jgi:hypothetical protein
VQDRGPPLKRDWAAGDAGPDRRLLGGSRVAHEQEQLSELLKTFEDAHPSLARRLGVIAPSHTLPLPAGYRASLSTDSTTQPSGLAFVGTGTSRDR